MINSITKEILRVINQSDYQKGSQYNEDYIDFIGVTTIDRNKRFQFLVESESSHKKYMVQIEMNQNKIEATYCTCSQWQSIHSCKHVAACSILYSDQLFSFVNEKVLEQKSQIILRRLSEQYKQNSKKKKEVSFLPMITIETGYYHNYVSLKVKIGMDKTYSFLGKFSSFMYAYRNQQAFSFGTSFTYDPREHFFSLQSQKLLEFIEHLRT